MIKLASWNVNSLKIRFEQVLTWIQDHSIDVLALQEIKLIDEHFPTEAFQDLGYHSVCSGQKSYNGVAILSRFPIENVCHALPHFEDPQKRILAVTTANLRLINVYIPNGNLVGSLKYQYKLDWLQAFTHFLKKELELHPKVAVVGDFNIAPTDEDVHDPQAWIGKVHVSPEERQAFQTLLSLGLEDSFRLFPREEKLFSWWDYRAGAFRRNHGLRIDHILLNPGLSKQCLSSSIDQNLRKLERPSDHAPVLVELTSE